MTKRSVDVLIDVEVIIDEWKGSKITSQTAIDLIKSRVKGSIL